MLAGRDPALWLMVEGPTGIGKTWLVKRLHHEAETQSFPASHIDFASGEAFDGLLMVHRIALDLGSRHFDTLNKTLEKATELEVVLRVESSPGGGGVTFYGDVEIHGDVAGRDIIKGNTFNLQANNPETRRIWQERINEAFFADLGRLGLARGAALLFDSYEQVTNEARLWIENRLLGRIGEGKLRGVQVVLASDQFPSSFSAWHGLVAELRLERLPAAEVRKYLRDKRQLVISEANIATISEITDGRPDLVALIAESNPKRLPEEPDKDRLLEILVTGILKKAEAPIPETLRKAAIAEWFDAALLADLLGTTTGVDDRLADLQVYSFVYADERGHLRFSPTVRQVLLKTWAERPKKFRDLHDSAARHFDERARRAADPREREELERQAVGHWLVADECTGQDRLRALFEENEDRYRLAACELLLQRAEAVKDLTDETQTWLQYLQGRLALARNDYKRSAALFDDLLKETDPEPELHALAEWSLGRVAAEQGEWAKAIDRYESSLQYFTGKKDRAREGQVMLALGDVYLQQARALGGPIRPRLLRRGDLWRLFQAIPAFLVSLPFVVYAWAIRRWRFLPPLHHGMNYRNWTLGRLLLTAVSWYRDAEGVFAAARQKALSAGNRQGLAQTERVKKEELERLDRLLADVRQGLAQTYHRLGRWHAARGLFDELLRSEPVVSNPYRQAQVRKEIADTELAAGNSDKAIKQLEKSLETFGRYQDVQAQAETRALLGQAWMQKGQFERGLALYRQSLEGFSAIGDRLGTGLALHALRRWTQRSDPTPDQAAQVEALIATTREKTYLPRVPDRLAAVLELAVSISLPLLAVIGLIAFGVKAASTPTSELLAQLVSIGTLLWSLGRLVLFAWVYVIGTGLIGLLLIAWGTRRKLEPERLGRIVVSDDAITRYDYRGEEVSRIPWHAVQAVVYVERVPWQKPIALLSEFWLFGAKTAIQVPATMLWYDALKKDIEYHLGKHNPTLIRRYLDLHILRSWLGLLFVLCPLLIGLQRLITWNVAELPVPIGLAALAGPILMLLGILALVAGPYWWLVLQPLRAHYELESLRAYYKSAPRSRMPWVAGILGLIIVAFAFFLSYLQPFFPIRNLLDWTVHPLGFLLIIVAAWWVLTACPWRPRPGSPEAGQESSQSEEELATHEEAQRSVLPYPLIIRIAAAIVLMGVVVLTGMFVQREWIPYFYIYRAITYLYRDAYQSTIVNSSQALAMNADLADGYFFRAQAYIEIGEYQLAVDDFSHLINSRSTTVTHYLLFRAKAYKALDNPEAACADLKSALGTRRWRLREKYQNEAQDAWREWSCDRFEDIAEDGQGSSP